MNNKQVIKLNESQFNSLVTNLVKESVKKLLKEDFIDDGLKKYVEDALSSLNRYETIGDKMRKLGFDVEYDGRTICNFSSGNTYFYASNHNTPFWKLDDMRVFD